MISQKYLTGTADGSFGAKTKIALQSFQKKEKLQQTGTTGPQTRGKINSYLKTVPKSISATTANTATNQVVKTSPTVTTNTSQIPTLKCDKDSNGRTDSCAKAYVAVLKPVLPWITTDYFKEPRLYSEKFILDEKVTDKLIQHLLTVRDSVLSDGKQTDTSKVDEVETTRPIQIVLEDIEGYGWDYKTIDKILAAYNSNPNLKLERKEALLQTMSYFIQENSYQKLISLVEKTNDKLLFQYAIKNIGNRGIENGRKGVGAAYITGKLFELIDKEINILATKRKKIVDEVTTALKSAKSEEEKAAAALKYQQAYGAGEFDESYFRYRGIANILGNATDGIRNSMPDTGETINVAKGSGGSVGMSGRRFAVFVLAKTYPKHNTEAQKALEELKTNPNAEIASFAKKMIEKPEIEGVLELAGLK